MRRLILSLLLISVFGLVLGPRQAAADEYSFDYQFGGDTFMWELPSSLIIAPANYDTGVFFSVLDVPYSENGIAQTPGVLQFYNSDPMVGGGFALADSSETTLFLNAFGPQVYSGMESAPTFVPGTYMLNTGLPDSPLATLVIGPIVSTPEPGTLPLLLIGTGVLALVCFARRKTYVA